MRVFREVAVRHDTDAVVKITVVQHAAVLHVSGVGVSFFQIVLVEARIIQQALAKTE